MTHPNRLERDLMNNASKRLTLWIKDTIMRCEAVDLPGESTLSIILTCLTESTDGIISSMNMSPADYCTMLYHGLIEIAKHRREAEKHS